MSTRGAERRLFPVADARPGVPGLWGAARGDEVCGQGTWGIMTPTWQQGKGSELRAIFIN